MSNPYRELLLSEGGGFLPIGGRIKTDRSAHIFIGLGGCGVDVLRELKRDICQHLQPDRVENGIPQFDRLRFLAIDSDRISLCPNEALFELTDREKFDLGKIHVGVWPIKKAELDPKLNWFEWDESYRYGTEFGAGGSRQLGRLFAVEEAEELKDRFIDLVYDLYHQFPFYPIEIQVHIVCGLGGGTGSGALLDVCYLAKHVMENFGARYTTRIYGFMPDVLESKAFHEEQKNRIRGNAYAALKELDHFMQADINGARHVQHYGNFEVYWNKPPASLCYLVSEKNEQGILQKDSYRHAVVRTARFLADMLTDYGIPFVTPQSRMMQSVFYGLTQKRVSDGAYRGYAGFGAERKRLPINELITLLAGEILLAIQKVPKREFEKQEWKELLSECRLTDEKMFASFYSVFSGFQTAEYTALGMRRKVSDEALKNYFSDQYENEKAKMEEYMPKLFEQIRDNLFSQIEKYAVDIHCGMLETAEFVHGLPAMIDGLRISRMYRKKMIGKEFLELEEEYTLTDQKRQKALFAKSLFYKQQELYVRILRLKLDTVILEQIDAMLLRLEEELKDYLNTVLTPVQRFMWDLVKSAEYNRADHVSGGIYEDVLADGETIASMVSVRLEQVDLSAVYRNLTYALLEAEGDGRSKEEKMLQTVKSFFTELLADTANMTATEWLAEICQSNQTAAQEQYLDSHIKQMNEFAACDFWISQTAPGYDPAKSGYLAVAQSCPAAVRAAVSANSGWAVNTAVFDRISAVMLMSGIPLHVFADLGSWAYSYTGLQVRTQLHIDRKFADLPELFLPSDMPDFFPQPVKEKLARRLECYEKALEIGLLQLDRMKMYLIVYTFEENWWNDITARIEALPHTVFGEMPSEELIHPRLVPTGTVIRYHMTPADAYSEGVLKERFLFSPPIADPVQEDVKRYETAYARIKQSCSGE